MYSIGRIEQSRVHIFRFKVFILIVLNVQSVFHSISCESPIDLVHKLARYMTSM